MFHSVLIANRGEIACRVMRTARRLGLRTIAVYSEADAEALHVREANEAHLIGPAPARQSYLDAGRILAVARRAGAECLHPGYGFLSENAEFAEACAAAGVVFVGPPPAAIRAMGLKDAAKKLMEEAGVPVVPGYHGAGQDPELLEGEAARIGYPVLIKAIAGGGGKGMRRVERAAEFAEALASCRREAQAAFGDERVLIERYIPQPRHIEIQVFADRHGNAVHLFERDCSLQRRHQKVIEESPAPGLSQEMRMKMGAAAVAAAKAVGYAGAGTVEFIADASNGLRPDGFYFMEMNTRLQVEHPVTEMVTGLDLVELQFRAAAGENLAFGQKDLKGFACHAAEARLYAEDPASGFLPQPGPLHVVRWPQHMENLRIDTGVESGAEISPHYDPMIAKVIGWGRTREAALQRLAAALDDTVVLGVRTNLGFLARLARQPEFIAGTFDTHFIDRRIDALIDRKPPAAAYALAAFAWLEHLRRRDADPGVRVTEERISPWDRRDGFTLGLPRSDRLHLLVNGAPVQLDIAWGAGAHSVRAAGEGLALSAGIVHPHVSADLVAAAIDGRRARAHVHFTAERVLLLCGAHHLELRAQDLLARDLAAGEGAAVIRAPMSGKLIRVLTEAGAAVKKGQRLAVLEAMKMEHALAAGFDAVVKELAAREGQQVEEGRILIVLESVAEGSEQPG